MAAPAPQQPTQPPLIPTLYALLAPTSLDAVRARISLLSLHAEPHIVHDKIYLNSASVLPNQKRMLRLRSRARSELGLIDGAGRVSKIGDDADDADSQTSLTYISHPLSGREYEGISVRAVVDVDVGGLSLREDVEDFVQTLGFEFSHEYTRTGLLFHLPLPHPTLTLHLSITRLHLPSDKSGPEPTSLSSPPITDEPYLVQLYPSRPIPSVNSRGEVGLADVVDLMRGMAGRVDGLEWGTGR